MKPMRACIACLLTLTSTAAFATERYHTSTVHTVYPVSNGDFVIMFDSDPSTCSNAGVPKYFHVVVGQNGMTAAGASKIFAAAMVAFVSGYQVSIHFNDATNYCYVNRISVTS